MDVDVKDVKGTADKDDDASRSSADEKMDEASADTDTHGTLKKHASSSGNQLMPVPSVAKRTVLLGLGGFNSKTRARKITELNELDAATGADSANVKGVTKRKKKVTIEDQIPTNMQEAFFGSSVLARTREESFNPDETELDENKLRLKLAATMANQHRIILDENMLRSAQAGRKGHPLELGIEDFLDGDIVSYLFSENRNLIDYDGQDFAKSGRNSSDDKIFDEGLYEDLFQQMVAEPTKTKTNANGDVEDFNINGDVDLNGDNSPSTTENNLSNMDSLNKINSQTQGHHQRHHSQADSSQTHLLSRFHSHDPSHHHQQQLQSNQIKHESMVHEQTGGSGSSAGDHGMW